MGKTNLYPVKPPKSTDIYIICHTSGTTGVPKGAMISHQALIATMSGPIIQWCGNNRALKIDRRDVYMSFLSPAHTYEQIMQVGKKEF
jgi:long-chain acyl-CoA synthetase